MRVLWEDIVQEAVSLVDAGRQRGLILRIAGSGAVALYAPAAISTRPLDVKDIDLVSDGKCRRDVQRLFAERAYEIVKDLLLLSEDRETYLNNATSVAVDVYYGAIDGSHAIDLSKRLGPSYPTISLTDLLLSKLQRHTMREVDIWDCRALLSNAWEHIEPLYFQQVLGRDWGLYTTVLDNLELLTVCYPDVLKQVSELRSLAERAERSIAWRVRGTIGRRVKWWKEVYDVRLNEQEDGGQ
jgi:hypothetical protein